MKYSLYLAGIGYVGHVNTLLEAIVIARAHGLSTVRGIGWTVENN